MILKILTVTLSKNPKEFLCFGGQNQEGQTQATCPSGKVIRFYNYRALKEFNSLVSENEQLTGLNLQAFKKKKKLGISH